MNNILRHISKVKLKIRHILEAKLQAKLYFGEAGKKIELRTNGYRFIGESEEP
jgi:hypothetical protein